MQTIADFQARLLHELSAEEMSRVFPIIEQQLLDSKRQVKNEAISLVKNFFPDPHEDDEDCTDCLIINSLAETLEVYLPVRLEEDE